MPRVVTVWACTTSVKKATSPKQSPALSVLCQCRGGQAGEGGGKRKVSLGSHTRTKRPASVRAGGAFGFDQPEVVVTDTGQVGLGCKVLWSRV